MIKSEDIPPEVVEALRPGTCCGCDKCLSKALATALNAWPNATVNRFEWGKAWVNLPLPQRENTSDD